MISHVLYCGTLVLRIKYQVLQFSACNNEKLGGTWGRGQLL